MSQFKVEFTLKQHTPIIHFQSDQSGATLRATELKPKFDRFLKKYAFNDSFEEYKAFLIGYDEKKKHSKKDFDWKEAFDYKIKIFNQANTLSTPKAYVNPKKETDKTAYQSPYFAEVSKSIVANTKIKIEFFSFNQNLTKILETYKDAFFVYENFGTRQSKGFGSFLRSDIEENQIKEILLKHSNRCFFLATYKDYQDAFLKIDTFYKKLKMGINNPYYKSLLFRYMCDVDNVGWEKKFIKKNFPEVIHGEHQPIVCKDDKHYKYIRVVLGLAEHNEFRPKPPSKEQVKIKSSDGIERFKSPITFKVFNGNIYLLFNDSYKQILNKEFIFSLNKKEQTISSPKEFDLYKFLKYVEKETSLISEVK